MNTLTGCLQETFKLGDIVFFRKPETEKYSPGLGRLETYIKEMTRGPFIVIEVNESENPEAHPQMVTLGDSQQKPLTIRFGNGPIEPLEVSGYWLTREE